ncbi:MAG: hypothetical protein JXQ27_12960 [Acidobacteria bacterium]|nr:hypothetical protein [Acidobacteriota bacterium]
MPLSPAQGTDLIFPYVVCSEPLGYYTGITLISLAEQGGDWVTLEAYDEDGNWLADHKVILYARQKYVRLVDQLFDVASPEIIRSIRVHAPFPLTGFELFGSYVSPGVAGLPVALSVAASGGQDVSRSYPYQLVLSEIMPDEEYYTGVTVSNLGEAAVPFDISLFGANGDLLSSRFWPEPVAPGRQLTREIWNLAGSGVIPEAAWLEVSSPEAIQGFELYLSRTDPFRFDGLPGTTAGHRRLVFPHVPDPAQWVSMLNVTSPADEPVPVILTAYSADGTVAGTAEEEVPPFGQHTFSLDTLFPAAAVAWLEVRAAEPVRGDLVTLAVDLSRMSGYGGVPME